ncbi:MAG: hypothetical protein ACLSGI_11115 [Butyricicoccaceae bacterium]
MHCTTANYAPARRLQCIGCLSRRVASVGCRIVTARGDIIR